MSMQSVFVVVCRPNAKPKDLAKKNEKRLDWRRIVHNRTTFSCKSRLALLSIKIWTISALPRCAAEIKAVSPSYRKRNHPWSPPFTQNSPHESYFIFDIQICSSTAENATDSWIVMPSGDHQRCFSFLKQQSPWMISKRSIWRMVYIILTIDMTA